jgi:gas vesicle protein
MERVEMDSSRISGPLTFLAGLGAGIAVAVLFTPRSGPATRRLVGRTVEKGEDWMKNKATAAQEYVKGCGEELVDRAKEVAEVIGRD